MVCGEASLGSQGTSSDRQQRVHRGYDDSDHCSPRQMGLPTLLDTECYPTVGYRGPEVRQASLQSCFGQSPASVSSSVEGGHNTNCPISGGPSGSDKHMGSH